MLRHRKFLPILFLIFCFFITRYTLHVTRICSAADANVLSDLQDSFARIAESAKPAVVNISSTRIERTQLYSYRSPFGEEDPFDEFFRHFFGPEYGTRKQQSIGSGVIIDKRGYVLTNYHVVERASDIQVALGDGRNKKSYPGKIVGKDSRTDLAVIKIEPKKNEDFPTVPLGDSDKIRIGDWAVALGSPFGLEHTLTVGVISAKRQNVTIQNNTYEDLIQTDASINPGNSGGPLLNLKGKVIGINTAIFSPSGGFVGVGFAIPINKAKEILEDLIEKGKVTRGYLGVKTQDITDELVRSFGLPGIEGALVSEVIQGEAAEKAGVKRGDVIVQAGDKPIQNSNDLRSAIGRTQPGKKITLKIIRSKKEIAVEAALGKAPEEEGEAAAREEAKEERIGITVKNSKVQLDPLGKSVVVSKVEPGSSAQDAGIAEGDIIKEVNNKEIKDVSDFESGMKDAKDTVLLLIKRGTSMLYVAVELK